MFMKNIINNNFITPKYNKEGVFLRQTHSFKLRYRPLQNNIINIIKKNWCNIGINFSNQLVDLNNMFYKKNLPIILEIGFGFGENIFYSALNYPKYNILGIEVYMPGIGCLIQKIDLSEIKINNLKIVAHDALEVLQYMICDNSIHVIQLFFPDPWPKTCHHKRRILQLEFMRLISKKLIYNGVLHVITDCMEYAEHILKIIGFINNITNLSDLFNCYKFTNIINNTHFGKKAILKNNKIFNLIFQFR